MFEGLFRGSFTMAVFKIADSIYLQVNDDCQDAPWIIISPDVWGEVIGFLMSTSEIEDVLR